MNQNELLQAPTMHHLRFIQIYPVIDCTLTLQVHHALSSPLGLNISLAVHFSLLGLQPSQGFSCICCQHRKNNLSLSLSLCFLALPLSGDLCHAEEASSSSMLQLQACFKTEPFPFENKLYHLPLLL